MINIKDLGELPKNVFIYSYVPQVQVLKESNIFITYGGINSINERILLPLIVVPQEMDQIDNGKQIEKFEAGICLDKNNLSSEILKDSVNKILENESKYKKGIEILYKSFKEAREKRKNIYKKIFE